MCDAAHIVQFSESVCSRAKVTLLLLLVIGLMMMLLLLLECSLISSAFRFGLTVMRKGFMNTLLHDIL